MALENWLQTLRAKETYRSGVYAVNEYGIQRGIFGGGKLPPVPRADSNRHIIVMEVIGGEPVLLRALTPERPTIHVPAQGADRILFISVEMRPQALDVAATSGTYRLADGDEVRCGVALEWRVVDAEAFWNGELDPVASLRLRVIEAVRRFLGGLTTSALLDDKVQVERELVATVFDRTLTTIKNGVETHVHRYATVAGARIEGVSAVIELSQSIKDHLQRMHKALYGAGGLADRNKVDKLLDLDQTYHPYKVRDVARALGMHLLENFYSQPFPEAMRTLAAAFEAKKAEHQPVERLKTMEEELVRAQRMQLPKEHIDEMKLLISEASLDSLKRPDTRSVFSDQIFLKLLIGPSRQTSKIKSDTDEAGDDE